MPPTTPCTFQACRFHTDRKAAEDDCASTTTSSTTCVVEEHLFDYAIRPANSCNDVPGRSAITDLAVCQAAKAYFLTHLATPAAITVIDGTGDGDTVRMGAYNDLPPECALNWGSYSALLPFGTPAIVDGGVYLNVDTSSVTTCAEYLTGNGLSPVRRSTCPE